MDFNEPAIAIILLLILFIGLPTRTTATQTEPKPKPTTATKPTTKPKPITTLPTENLQEKVEISSEKLCVDSGDDGAIVVDGVRTYGQICPLTPGNDEAIEPLNMVAIDPVAVVEDAEPIAAGEVVYQAAAGENQVEELFDRAWSEGVKTYNGLIEYVKISTGRGTSKTRVKAWKVERGYVDA